MRIRISFIIFTLLALLASCGPKTDSNKLIDEIGKEIKAGNFFVARRLADSLKVNCSEEKQMIRKADSLIDITERISLDFSLSEQDVITKLEKLAGPLPDSSFSQWEKKMWLENRIINGKIVYFNRAASNLLLIRKFHEDKEGMFLEFSRDPEKIFRLKHTEEIIKASGNQCDPVVPVSMAITYTITVKPDAVPEGEKIRCWLPYPKENIPRQSDVYLLAVSNENFILAPDSAVHRSIYMENKAEKGLPVKFSISYSYRSSGQYFDMQNLKILPYNKRSSLYRKYTSEQLPQISFTDNIKHLADSLTDPEDNPYEIVKKIYFWFKENIVWTRALEYSIMPDIPEYVYRNRRGDCGMQTFLFMSMLRYKGVPVRWQSGWMVPPGAENLHDWCEVYYEGTGWIPVNISYDLQHSENQAVKGFYLSGIDSYRLIVNDGVAGSFYPAKQYPRSEPFDFQRGEVEWKGGNLYFDKWDYEMKIEYLK